MTEATQRTSDNGVSIWLDDLSRTRIESGSLQELIKDKNVVGVTTNPSIFQKALSQVGPYDAQLKELGKVDVETAVRELTTTDVRNATDIFREIAEATDFVDGRVSIEVDPRLAHDTENTEKQAVELWEKVNRPNAMIKIPATLEGLPAITATLAKGISVNVTLIFSLERYEQVIDAYIEGIAQAAANGHDLKHIGSVASFFVSRVDTAVDKLLEAAPMRPRPLRARPLSPTPASPTSSLRRSSPPILAGLTWPPRAPRSSVRCGPPPAPRTPPTPTASTSTSSLPSTSSTRCPRRP